VDPRAACIAAAIHQKLGFKVFLEMGGPDQFDVFVDDELLVGKDENAGIWEHSFGNRGFPTPERVVELLEERLKGDRGV
jgi:hypothetical protein